MSQYILPFKQGDIIAEFGGGEKPVFCPNIDIRRLPGVDIVADFNKPLPIPSESYDGIYSNYNLEHISWRSVNRLLREICRILKPGGIVVFVTANLLEQARILVNSQHWNDDLICMLFGGQRFDEKTEFDEQWDGNAHHCGFSPEYITKLLKEIGFKDIKIIPIQTDVGPTDMIVEAKKSTNTTNMTQEILSRNNNDIKDKHPFNREYFEGDTYVGTGYQDFPVHYNTIKMILDRKPQSVIDIGGARGYIAKKLNDLNIPATCIDISEHCYHTRATDNFVLHDLTKVPYPFGDKQFDLVVSISVLEHIPEDKIPSILKEIARISKRGLHGITFESLPSDVDKTHINIKPIEWWKNKFKDVLSSYPNYSYEILDKEDTEKDIINLPQSDNLVKLNIGSFINMFHHSWKNIDIIDLNDFARQRGYIFKQIDITKGSPYNDNSVDIIISSHFLEHITREEGLVFLKECYRTLKPNSIIRLTVPDTELLTKKYIDGTIEEYRHVNLGVEKSTDNVLSLFELLLTGHKTIYDYDSISKLLSNAGFINVQRMKFGKSNSKEIEKQTIDMYPTLSLYVEATKSDIVDTEIIKEYKNIKTEEQIISTGPTISTGPIIDTKCSLPRNTPLRIALISTPFFTVPPKGYGGLEQILWDLAAGLDKLGHEVTIFGPEGSMTPKHGHLIVTGSSNNTVNVDWLGLEKKNYEMYKQYITPENFDIIHDHSWFAFPYLSKMNNPKLKVLHTNHGGYSWESSPPVSYPNLVAISNFMKQYTIQYFGQKGYNVCCQHVHNGIDLDKYPFNPDIKRTNRLLYVGRFSKFKQPHLAIQVAKRANLPIDLIGGTFVDDINYLKEIESMHDGSNIIIYKDADHDFKIKKMQEAKALIFPSKMGEPLGLVAQKAMACGTPVIASKDGAIPEVVLHNKTGFICDTEEEMVKATKNIDKIDPLECRKRAEEFSRLKMAENYVKLYQRILDNEEW